MELEMLEKIAAAYEFAKKEWMQDRTNAFKDARFATCYEICRIVKECADGELLAELRTKLHVMYAKAKSEWLADRKNPYKDARFLTYWEFCALANL